MLEKFGLVKNPLSIIAIFAGIAEISGTVVLPFVQSGNQLLYIWFLILFPSYLVSLFFITLNFNHKVLYAPSDYQNEDNFVKTYKQATKIEKAKKIEQEITDIQKEPSLDDRSNKSVSGKASVQKDNLAFRMDKEQYIRTEDQVIRKLEEQIGEKSFREVKFNYTNYVFDGAFIRRGLLILYEIKMLTRTTSLSEFNKFFERIDSAIQKFDRNKYKNIHLILGFAIYNNGGLSQVAKAQLEAYQSEKDYSIEVQYFNFNNNKEEEMS